MIATKPTNSKITNEEWEAYQQSKPTPSKISKRQWTAYCRAMKKRKEK